METFEDAETPKMLCVVCKPCPVETLYGSILSVK